MFLVCTQIQHGINFGMIHSHRPKCLNLFKWWKHCSSNSLFFRHRTAKHLIICFVSKLWYFCPAEPTNLVFRHFEAATEWQHVSADFSQKRPGTKANSKQLQNIFPLFVWQNKGKFMQSVIRFFQFRWCFQGCFLFDIKWESGTKWYVDPAKLPLF